MIVGGYESSLNYYEQVTLQLVRNTLERRVKETKDHSNEGG